MTLIKSKHSLGWGNKKVLTNEDIEHVESLITSTFNLTNEEVKNDIGFVIETEINGIKRDHQLLRPTKKFFVNDNEFICYATRYEDGKTIITIEDEETGDYNSLYDPREWE